MANETRAIAGIRVLVSVWGVRNEAFALLVLWTLDVITTLVAVHFGAVEVNAVAQALLEEGPGTFATAKLLGAFAIVAVALRVNAASKQTKWGTVAMRVTIGFMALIVAFNVTMLGILGTIGMEN